jgi:holliday junction DNA helicase RuvA
VKKALKAMAFSVKTIADAISRQDSKWLSALPGIGPTTAQQIVVTLQRKVTPFIMLSAAPAAEPAAPDAVVEEKTGGKKAKSAKKAEPEPAAPQPLVTATDGRLIEDVYEALMGLGHNPLEARAKLDALLTCGKPFRSMQEAITLIYSTKG